MATAKEGIVFDRKNKLVAKHEVLARKLRSEIGEMANGDKLPSVRNLMEHFGVGQSVVEKALLVLKEDGVVESKARRGTFANPEGLYSAKIFDVLFFEAESGLKEETFHYYFLHRLARLLGTRDQSIRVNVLGVKASYPEFPSLIENKGMRVALAVGIRSAHLLDVFKERGIPYVLVFPNFNVNMPNSVLIDNEKAMRDVIEHLVALGHKNIGCIHHKCSEEYHRDMWQRLDLFYQLVAEKGLTTYPEWVRFGGWSLEMATEATNEILHARPGRPTALVTSDVSAPGIYQAAKKEKLIIGRDLSVVGFDDMPWALHMDPPLTTVHNFLGKEAELAVSVIDELMAGKDEVPPHLVKTKLLVRSSTGPVARK